MATKQFILAVTQSGEIEINDWYVLETPITHQTWKMLTEWARQRSGAGVLVEIVDGTTGRILYTR